MELRFTLSRLQSVFFGSCILCLQMALFFGGVFVLSSVYHPYDPSASVAGDMAWSLYPFALYEIGIFVCSAMIAFRVSRWDSKTVTALFAAEIGALLFVQLLSGVWGYACTMLISLSHFQGISTPTCGISSLNPLSMWFGVFCVLTVVLWEFILQQRARAKVPSESYNRGVMRIIFETTAQLQ